MLNDGVKTPILASAKNIGELQSDDSLIEAPLCNRRYNQGRKFGQSNHSLPRLLLRQEAISEICGRTSSGITKNLLKNSPMKHNKMPLPLYPKKKKPILEKIKSEEVGFSPLQNFSNEKGSCVTKNGILKKTLSSKDRRSLYKNLCKGTNVSNDCDQDQSLDHKSTSGKVTSNLSTYKPCSSDDTVGHFSAQKFGKLPKLSSPEMKRKLMKMAQNSMKGLNGNGAVPSAAQISPKKNCQNERFPKYKFSMSTKASSQKEVSNIGCKSIPKIPELQEKTLKDSKELDYKRFDSLDDALLEIPDEENDTFKLDETLGSLFTMERDEVLSVSDDSVLSEITQKSKKKHIVIKMKKKCDRKCLK